MIWKRVNRIVEILQTQSMKSNTAEEATESNGWLKKCILKLAHHLQKATNHVTTRGSWLPIKIQFASFRWCYTTWAPAQTFEQFFIRSTIWLISRIVILLFTIFTSSLICYDQVRLIFSSQLQDLWLALVSGWWSLISGWIPNSPLFHQIVLNNLIGH